VEYLFHELPPGSNLFTAPSEDVLDEINPVDIYIFIE
jgi:hypothetical protein